MINFENNHSSHSYPLSNNTFESFWMAGYECSDKLNAFGHRVDFLELTAHLSMIAADYHDLASIRVKTVREGIRWSQVEKKPYQYDWSTVEKMITAGKTAGIQQVWDICHFGFADDLTPLHPLFARRFAALSRAFVQFYRLLSPEGELIVTPINEVSFLSWLGGDARGTSPYCVGQGWEVKYALMRAYIEGSAAMREVDPGIRFLATEPLVQMVPPFDATEEEIESAATAHLNQYQVADILSGRMCAELGGSPEYLDILGLNFYFNNRWVNGTGHFLPWGNENMDPRFRSFSSLMEEAYHRYKRPLVLSETSHPGSDRPAWIKYIAEESALLIDKEIPYWGICIYPIIDRPDWDHLQNPWHNSGLWDMELAADGSPKRVLYQPYAEALHHAQQLISDQYNNVELRNSVNIDTEIFELKENGLQQIA
ncbi:MAG: amine oxidase [Chitinophagaceae bacterium]